MLQFYPENANQIEMISSAAMRCGFTGGLLVDYPHSTKAKKYFLVLFTGASNSFQMPKALGLDEAEEVSTEVAYGGRSTAPFPFMFSPDIQEMMADLLFNEINFHGF